MCVALQTGSNVANDFLNPDTYILMTISGHFVLSVAKVVELLALENGTKKSKWWSWCAKT